MNESPQRKKARTERNRARASMLRQLTSRHGSVKAKAMMKGKDVDHIKPLALGGKGSLSNLRLRNKHANRADKSTIFRGKKTTRPKNPRRG